MSIIDELRDHGAKKQFEADNKAAIQMFERQKNSVIAISESQGFREIMNYLDRDIMISESFLSACKDPVQWARVAGGRDRVVGLRQFLLNLTRVNKAEDPLEQ